MIRTLDENIDKTKANEGILNVILDANTESFAEKINGRQKLNSYFQIRGTNVEGRLIYDYMFAISCLGAVDPGEAEPIPVGDNIATKDWTFALLRNSIEYQFSVDETEWHETRAAADNYYRTRYPEGEWSESILIVNGINGTNGVDGTSTTINIGTVTTGDAGTEAKVENVGTETNAIFNFTIPRGADGADGEDGTDGTTVDLTNYYTKTEIDNKIGNVETQLAEI